VVVVVDPGMAFGTAEHGTTRGALRLLDRALTPGERVLDVGAGSAILAIAAVKLWPGATALAIDNDPSR
jgi:ribosomal protein L11 methyltransferase